jgi:branched-chain amino acid transport system substrate-binding protein
MTHKLTRRSAAKGLALSAAALAFPAIGRAQAQSVKIAMIAPMSGPWARQGQLLRMGADLAIEDINARGGIKSLGGSKLNIIYGDAGDSTEKAKNAAQRLVADNPDLVGGTGSWLSSFTLAVTEVTERAQIPWLTLSYSDAITNRGFKFVFQIADRRMASRTDRADRSRHGAKRHRQAANHHWLDHGQHRLTDQFCQTAA